MTIFDGIVTALLEGLWTILFQRIFMAPGRAISRAWGLDKGARWAALWAFYGAVVFWGGGLCLLSLMS